MTAFDEIRRNADAGAGRAPWPVLKSEALVGLAGQWVEAVAPLTEADPAGLLVDFLVTFGAYVGSKPHHIVSGARHSLVENALFVGRTAIARKGMVRAANASLFREVDGAWSASSHRSGFASGEALVSDLADPLTLDHRRLVVETEFAVLLHRAQREGSTLSPMLRNIWDGQPLERRLADLKKTLVAQHHHVGVLGHITGEELQRMVSSTEIASGSINRYLITAVRRALSLPEGGDLTGAVGKLAEPVRQAASEMREMGLVVRTEEGRARWREIYPALVDEENKFGLVGHATARADAHCLRLSMLYALSSGSRRIDVRHIDAAKALWDYCEQSARWVWGSALGDPIADRLLEAFRDAAGKGLTHDEQYRGLFQKNVAGDRLAGARELLIRLGYATEEREPTEGRPTTRTFAAEHAPKNHVGGTS